VPRRSPDSGTGAWPKISQIIDALEGYRMGDHHCFLIR